MPKYIFLVLLFTHLPHIKYLVHAHLPLLNPHCSSRTTYSVPYVTLLPSALPYSKPTLETNIYPATTFIPVSFFMCNGTLHAPRQLVHWYCPHITSPIQQFHNPFKHSRIVFLLTLHCKSIKHWRLSCFYFIHCLFCCRAFRHYSFIKFFHRKNLRIVKYINVCFPIICYSQRLFKLFHPRLPHITFDNK